MSEEVQLQGIHNSNEGYRPLSPLSLHGRRQIFTNETEITRGNVAKVLNESLIIHNRNRSEEVYLEKYLRGIQPILERIKVNNAEICSKTVVNIANQIVTFKTAEFAGEPIQYISRGTKKSIPKKVEKLNSLMLSEGKQSKDMELAYKMFTAGVGYRLVLKDKALGVSKGEILDEAPFEIYVTDPRNSFVIRANDVTKRVIAGVTYVFLDESTVEFTVYTANETFKLKGTAQQAEESTIEETYHGFGLVNMVEYPCNSVYMGAFEVVLPLLDAINLTESDRLDAIEQFIQAILVFEGVDITREQLLEMKDLGAIKIPPSLDGRPSKVYYLNEQLDQSQTQTLVNDIYQTILQIVGMPSQGNANTSDSSNNGAIIMKNGWWNAEARSLETEGMWKEAETQFLKIVLKICEEANVLSGLAVSDVEPKFGRRSYEDLLVKTQSFSTLVSAGCPPIQCFKFSKMSKDPEADALEFAKYQEEKEAALNESLNVMTSPTDYGGDEEPAEGEEDEGGESGESESEGGSYGRCPVCGKQFRKKNGNQIYDSERCRQIARQRKSGGFR